MAGLVCPHCGGNIDLFGNGGGEREAIRQGITFLGKIPIDLATRQAGDSGTPVVLGHASSSVAQAMGAITTGIERTLRMTGSKYNGSKADVD